MAKRRRSSCDRWRRAVPTDTIAGKAVTRALRRGVEESALDAAPYFYAWGDTVIVIMAANPSFAQEALRALP
jgi:hypothetical protein